MARPVWPVKVNMAFGNRRNFAPPFYIEIVFDYAFEKGEALRLNG